MRGLTGEEEEGEYVGGGCDTPEDCSAATTGTKPGGMIFERASAIIETWHSKTAKKEAYHHLEQLVCVLCRIRPLLLPLPGGLSLNP